MAKGKRVTASKASKEFFALPSKDKPATTTGASVRNFVYNMKEMAKVPKEVGEFLSNMKPPKGRKGR